MEIGLLAQYLENYQSKVLEWNGVIFFFSECVCVTQNMPVFLCMFHTVHVS